MAKVEVDLVNRVWARDPAGELVRFAVTRRSGMTMEAIIEKDEAEEVMKKLWSLLNPVEYTDLFDGGSLAYQRQIGGSVVIDIEGQAQPLKVYYVYFNGASYFVKEEALFREQGGTKDGWGNKWKPVAAHSIEQARKIAATLDWTDALTIGDIMRVKMESQHGTDR